jgi:hypothetical protein
VASAGHHSKQGISIGLAGAAVQGLDSRPVAGLAEVPGHELRVAAVIQRLPDRDRLGREASVGESHHQRRPWTEHPSDFAQHGHGLDQVLDGYADGGAVELCWTERQTRIGVQVLDNGRVEPRVGRKLLLVEAQPDHSSVGDLRRQVTDPATHQIEDRPAGRE